MKEHEALSIKETAAALGGVSIPKVYDEIKAGRLKSFKLGRRHLISKSAIANFIADREAEQENVQ